MSRQWIVTSPREATLLTGEQLLAAAEERFGHEFVVSPQLEGPADFHIYVSPRSGREFTISHYRHDKSISFEATEEQRLELAAWIRGLLPADHPRVIACDQGWLGHVDLTAGITSAEARSRWVDHAVPGWNDGDPDFA